MPEPLLRRLLGVIFIPAGLVKFVFYEWELGNFERFGLPAAPAWVVAAGLIEAGGGVPLLRDRPVVPTAALLAATMAVAVAVSGIKEGDVVPSLTLAPLLLVGCLLLVSRRARRTAGRSPRPRPR